jgi:hypothetical protein
LGMMAASLTAGQVTMRTGKYRKFPIIGAVLMVIGLALLHTVGADTSLLQTDLYMLIFGAGLGMSMQTLVLAMQNAVPPKDMGVSTAAATFFRQVGGTLGTAVFLSILFTAASNHIPSAYDKAATTPAFQAAAKAHPQDVVTLNHNLSASGGLNDTDFLGHIDKVLAHPFLVGFSQSMDVVFLVGACVLIIAFVLALFLREVPLRTQSGLQAQRAAEEATDPDFIDAGGATHDPEKAPPSSLAHKHAGRGGTATDVRESSAMVSRLFQRLRTTVSLN